MRSSFLHTALLASTLSSLVAGSKHILPLKRTGLQTPSSRALDSGCTNVTHLTKSGGSYTVPIQFGKDTFDVLFDTGSSDLWLASSNFRCEPEESPWLQSPLDLCHFGPRYNGTLSGGDTHETFHITYGDGRWVRGNFIHEDITLAGISVKGQKAALANDGFWIGSGDVSGLLGFSYPGITSAISATGKIEHYKPFFWNAVEQKKVEPMFSLALNRETEGDAGQLALGYLPDVQHKGDFVSTPMKKDFLVQGAANFTHYYIVPDAFILKADSFEEDTDPSDQLTAGRRSVQTGESSAYVLPNDAEFVVDSGTAAIRVPDAVAAEFARLFVPPAQLNPKTLFYEVPCNVKIPTFGIRIAGNDFYIDKRELLFGSEQTCTISIRPKGSHPNILGATFLRNVVAVFDIGRSEMRFAAR